VTENENDSSSVWRKKSSELRTTVQKVGRVFGPTQVDFCRETIVRGVPRQFGLSDLATYKSLTYLLTLFEVYGLYGPGFKPRAEAAET